MPYSNYNSILYNSSNRKISYDSIVINENIWLNYNSNVWCGKYNYTYSSQRENYFNKKDSDLNEFLDKLQPASIAQKYYMKNFIYNDTKDKEKRIIYSKGTLYLGNQIRKGRSQDQNQSLNVYDNGKIDIISAIRSICRQEIEYALWNYTIKLVENNSSNDIVENLKPENIDNFRLKWFYNKRFPLKEITVNGFPIGTDDTEFKEIKSDINLKKKIFLL